MKSLMKFNLGVAVLLSTFFSTQSFAAVSLDEICGDAPNEATVTKKEDGTLLVCAFTPAVHITHKKAEETAKGLIAAEIKRTCPQGSETLGQPEVLRQPFAVAVIANFSCVAE